MDLSAALCSISPQKCACAFHLPGQHIRLPRAPFQIAQKVLVAQVRAGAKCANSSLLQLPQLLRQSTIGMDALWGLDTVGCA
jgi:hypothetical protein